MGAEYENNWKDCSVRQAALRSFRPKAWVWMWMMFIKGEAKQTREGGETQGHLVQWFEQPQKMHPRKWN